MLTEQDARLIASIDFAYTPEHAPVLPGRSDFQRLTPRTVLGLFRGPQLRRIDDSLENYNIARLDLLARNREYVVARDLLFHAHTARGLDQFLSAQQAHLLAFCACQWAFRDVTAQARKWLKWRKRLGWRKATSATDSLLSRIENDSASRWFASPEAALAVENRWQFGASLRAAS